MGVAYNFVTPETLERICWSFPTEQWKPHWKIPICSGYNRVGNPSVSLFITHFTCVCLKRIKRKIRLSWKIRFVKRSKYAHNCQSRGCIKISIKKEWLCIDFGNLFIGVFQTCTQTTLLPGVLYQKTSKQGVTLRKWENMLDWSQERRFSDIWLRFRPWRQNTVAIQSSHNIDRVSCPFQWYIARPFRCSHFENTAVLSFHQTPVRSINGHSVCAGVLYKLRFSRFVRLWVWA